MITLPLSIRYSESSQRKANAWLIPGSDPDTWIDELFRWQVPLSRLALYVVPQSLRDLSPRGLLVVNRGDCRPKVSPRSQPCARLAERLYLPANARLEPAVSDAELTALVGAEERTYLFHPAVGLIGFDPNDALSVHDLLDAPPATAADWGRAVPGIELPGPLVAIEPESIPSLESVLREGQDGIGTQVQSLDDLPVAPEEQRSGTLGRLARGVARGVLNLLGKLPRLWRRSAPSSSKEQGSPTGTLKPTRKESRESRTRGDVGQQAGEGVPGGLISLFGAVAAAAGAPFAPLADWIRRLRRKLDEPLQSARHRAVLRVLYLLKTEPDQGLRYAIPFDRGTRRGGEEHSATLPPREVDFNLDRIDWGGPVDYWHLPAELRQELLARYMELADRELRLGRHRRAAYIYAELLARLDLAASALVAGGYWREAALVYRHRLGRADEAARCLERGGLWSEAIALYAEIGQFEKAGDLCRKIDQPARAAEFYRLAVTQHAARGDLIAAARLLVDQLDAPDEALQRLDAGWPNSPQAGKCLEEFFRLLGQLGRHDQALQRIESLRGQSLSRSRTSILVSTLARLSTDYPADEVRRTAADATRTIVAARLVAGTLDEMPDLLAAIRRLVPSDQLLARDCQRFPDIGREKPRSEPARPQVRAPEIRLKRSPLRPALVGEFALYDGRAVEWQCVAAAEESFFIAGYAEGASRRRLLVGEFLSNGRQRWLEGEEWLVETDAAPPVLLAAPSKGRSDVLVHILDRPPLLSLTCPETDGFPRAFHAGTPAWLPQHTVAVIRGAAGIAWVLSAPVEGLMLHGFWGHGQPIRSGPIAFPLRLPGDSFPSGLTVPIPICWRTNAVYLGVENRLVIVEGSGRVVSVPLPDRALSLVVSPDSLPWQLVASLPEGVAAFALNAPGAAEIFAKDLKSPVAGFTRSGWLVIADSTECLLYGTRPTGLRLEGSMLLAGTQPSAILACPNPDHFALVQSDGLVRVYRLMRR